MDPSISPESTFLHTHSLATSPSVTAFDTCTSTDIRRPRLKIAMDRTCCSMKATARVTRSKVNVTLCENRGHYQLRTAAGRPSSAIERRDMAKATTDANTFVDDPRFNQKFDLLPSQGSSRDYTLKVTYADYGYRNEAHPEEETVLLWFGLMMASRLVGILRDKTARREKVRIISIDWPGMGGTDAVSGKSRIRTCRGVSAVLIQSHTRTLFLRIVC